MTPRVLSDRLGLFPVDSSVSAKNHLVVGGCDAVDLAREFGTPLYVFDEQTLRGQCRAFLREFGGRYPHTRVLYAAKAFLNLAMARLVHQEGLGMDVVSGGELAIAAAAEFPMERVYFHGNNKTSEEITYALDLNVGRVVLDNFHEIALLEALASQAGQEMAVLLRVGPGVDAHTHTYTTTGILDTKFGLPIATGQAEEAVRQVMAAPHLRLVGLHMHLGSPIFELEPYRLGLAAVLPFAAQMAEQYGLNLQELSPGGGFAIQYLVDRPAPPIGDYASAMVGELRRQLDMLGLGDPLLVLEPGRAIVGRAGVALYRVGSRKTVPGVRQYVSVDGGMGDNIRPALYEAGYEALLANRVESDLVERVTLAGKYCESGDVLVRDVDLPPLDPGDVVALPAAGAYCLAMASNYNASLRPAVVLVREGNATLIRRRETFEDLVRCDVSLP